MDPDPEPEPGPGSAISIFWRLLSPAALLIRDLFGFQQQQRMEDEDPGAAKLRRMEDHQCLSDALEFSPFEMEDLPEVKIPFFPLPPALSSPLC